MTSTIALFPEFTKLEIQHKDAVESITRKFVPYSDFNFTSLFCWDVDASTSISLLNDNLVVRMPDYITGEPAFSILGTNQIDASFDELFKWTGHLSFVPEHTIHALKDVGDFTVEEDRDHHDYIYEVAKLAALSGNKYKKIRNKLNSFVAANIKGVLVRTVRHVDETERKQLLGLFDEWSTHSSQKKEDLEAERKAFSQMLENSGILNLLFTIVKVGDKHIGLSVNEMLDTQYSICHFEKAISVAHHNTFSFLTNETAKALLERGSVYVNWEQDLGLEGTRKSKTSYRPVTFLKKYAVALN